MQVGVVSERVLQSVSFLKTVDKLCINLTKITAYIEYLIHGIFNNVTGAVCVEDNNQAWSR